MKEKLLTFEDYLEYVNEVITAVGDNGVRLTEEDLKKIVNVYGVIINLKNRNITDKNYKTRVKAYRTFREKALDEYGLILPRTIPFDNPTILWNEIEAILQSVGLSHEQRNAFYKSETYKQRIPRSDIYQSKKEDIDRIQMYKYSIDEEKALKDFTKVSEMSKEEWIQDNKQHQLTDEQYEIEQEYSVEISLEEEIANTYKSKMKYTP